MTQEMFEKILSIGETVAVEFKRCGNGIEHDTYETVCSFLNRFGGDIFLGVEDDRTVVGVPKKAAPDMVRNFISVTSNSGVFQPTVYLTPEIFEYENKTIIHIHVNPTSEVHKYKNVIYDRNADSDVKVTATGALAAIYIRKQNIYTERMIFPYATLEDLRLDLLPRVRQAAGKTGKHPWQDMDDMTLLKSAGLYGRDLVTGASGFNLACILLLGRDDVIQDACPTYETDALLRRVNQDRYDDRVVVRTNLIESFDQLMEFGRKNLPDKFYLEGIDRVSLRDILIRELVSNTLMHREYISSYTARFVIEKDRLLTENANRTVREGLITLDNLEPIPKNPRIATFFRIIGRADKVGSGVRKLYKYSQFYSGDDPTVLEGDIFKTIVPLNESYSYDLNMGRTFEKMHSGIVKTDYINSESQDIPNTEDNDNPLTSNTEETHDNVEYIAQRILDFCSEPRSKSEILYYFNVKDRKRFTSESIKPLLEKGLLLMTIPEKPNSKYQKYVAAKMRID